MAVDQFPRAMLATEDFGDPELVGDRLVLSLHPDGGVLNAGPEAEITVVAAIEDLELAGALGQEMARAFLEGFPHRRPAGDHAAIGDEEGRRAGAVRHPIAG